MALSAQISEFTNKTNRHAAVQSIYKQVPVFRAELASEHDEGFWLLSAEIEPWKCHGNGTQTRIKVKREHAENARVIDDMDSRVGKGIACRSMASTST